MLEGVVGTDFAGGFVVEDFFVVDGGLEPLDTAEVEAKAVDGPHVEDAVFAGVVFFFDPGAKEVVELVQAGDALEVSDEELIADGLEESFDLPFGRSVPDRGVDEDSSNAAASESDFLGGVVGSIIDVDASGDSSFEDGGLEAVDEVWGVVVGVKLSVWDHAGGIVDEANEIGAGGLRIDAEVGADEGVALPKVIGVRFGKGLSTFAGDLGFRPQELEAIDVPSEGVGGDL